MILFNFHYQHTLAFYINGPNPIYRSSSLPMSSYSPAVNLDIRYDTVGQYWYCYGLDLVMSISCLRLNLQGYIAFGFLCDRNYDSEIGVRLVLLID